MQSTRLQSNSNEFVRPILIDLVETKRRDLNVDVHLVATAVKRHSGSFIHWSSVIRNFLNFKSVMRNVFTCSTFELEREKKLPMNMTL